jgi:hypothetical protein
VKITQWWHEQTWLLPAAVVAVTLVGAAVAITRDYHAIGDFALPELFIRQISHRPPLIGPYSLFRGFSHPSPLFFYVAWIPYLVTGDRSSTVLAVSVLGNGLALAGAVWIAGTRRATGLAIALILCVAGISDVVYPALLLLPWNPYFALVPFLAALVATWAMWNGGSRWLLPVVVGLGSWCVGAHLSFGVVVLGLWAVCAYGVARPVVRGHARLRELRGAILVAVATLVVLWLPTAIDLVAHGSDSNAAAIGRFVIDPGMDRVPIGDVFKVLSSELSLRPYWAGGTRPETAVGIPGHASWPLGVFLVIGALVLARRRSAAAEVNGVLISLAMLGCALVGAALTHSPELLSWYLLPVDAAGIALAAFTFWSLARSALDGLADRDSTWPRLATAVVGVVAIATFGLRLITITVPEFQTSTGDATAAMAPQVVAGLDRDRHVVVGATLEAREAQPQFVLALARAGYSVTVPSSDAQRFGAWWSRAAPRDAVHLYMTAGTRRPESLRGRRVGITPELPFLLGGDRLEVWRTNGRA